jgi:hypothetical protein
MNQPTCLLINECINKILYVYITHYYYSSIKKNEIILFAGKWMELLEIIMLSEINQIHKEKILYVFSHLQNLDS